MCFMFCILGMAGIITKLSLIFKLHQWDAFMAEKEIILVDSVVGIDYGI